MMYESPHAPIEWNQAFANRIDPMRPSKIRKFLKLLEQPGIIFVPGMSGLLVSQRSGIRASAWKELSRHE